LADGGIARAIGERVARSGRGVRLGDIGSGEELFSEWPGRIVVCVDQRKVDAVRARAAAASVMLTDLGVVSGDRLLVDGLVDLAVDDVVSGYRDRLPSAMAAGALHE
jgi:phosphoribosylformylglycinamidine synthase subunit PurL